MQPNSTDKRLIAAAALVVMALTAGMLLAFHHPLFVAAALTFNYARSSMAPPGTLTLETAPVAQNGAFGAAGPTPAVTESTASSLDWPSYNRALTSARYSP